jgi:hypothetical protein
MKAPALNTLTKGKSPIVAKIRISPLVVKFQSSSKNGSDAKSMDDQDDSPPAFTWSKSDIPSICIALNCDELVPANIPQELSNLFRECAKLLYYSPSGSLSIDLLETRICINLGIFRLEDRAHQNAKGHGYPEINFRALPQRVLDMECNINLVVSDAVVRLDCIV